MNNSLIRFFSFLFVVLSAVAFFPTILSNSVLYNGVKVGIVIVLLSLAALSAPKLSFGNKLVVTLWTLTFLFLGELLMFYLTQFHVKWGDVISLVIVFSIMSIGYGASINERHLEFLIIIYGISSIILGLYSMNYYVGALTIEDYMYAVEAKNQIGQIVGTGAVGLLIILFPIGNKYEFFFKVILLILSVILLFTLRCRTALLAFLLFGVYCYLKGSTAKYKIIYTILMIIAIPFFLPMITSFMETVFVGSKDITDLDDLSSGRMDRNIYAIYYFFNYPLMGELVTESGIPNIHNYFLHRLVNYGLCGLPILAVYFTALFYFIKKWIRLDIRNKDYVGFWMMTIPFFCSLLEPSAPFGPGLVQAVPFLIFGCSLRLYDETKYVL